MTRKFTIDGDAIRQLADILVETDLSEIEYEDDGRRVRVARTVAATASVIPAPIAAPAPVAQVTAAPVVSDPANHAGAVKSPMVGTAYLSPEPGAAPFAKVGDTVTVGQTLLIIEAMKVMNPIKAPHGGVVTQVFARDAGPVEFGEPLMIIE